jgi:GMP synthase-like glutamine amidotransferase
MKAHVFQHAAFEGLGSIGLWLEARRADVRYTRFFDNEPLPAIDGADLLIAMGGPMSVNDEADFPWLNAEKQAVRDAIAKGIPLLGVCLGAQLIASALGARVYRNAVKEIGWFPVRGVHAPGAFQLPAERTVFHWHGETFDLPPAAVRTATSEGCENQAFQIGARVIGLQFHLEMMPAPIAAIVEHCRADLTPGPYVQTERELLSAPPARYDAANEVMTSMLSYLTSPRAGA